MRTILVIFILALMAIAGEICSDAVLTRGQVSPAAPDPAVLAVVHGMKHGSSSGAPTCPERDGRPTRRL